MSYKFLVIGCGSAGERHTKNLLSLGQEIAVTDIDINRSSVIANKYGVKVSSLSDEFDSFIICTPPDSHIYYIKEAIKYGAHIFVEKPLSNSLDGVAEVIEQARTKNLVLQVGYQFRFHPGLRFVKELLDKGKIGKLLSVRAEFGQYLPDWHPNEDYKNLYTAHEKLGGGIILDASHEIDYVRWLVGSKVTKVSCFADKLSNLEVDTEDTAEINLGFENGIIGNIHVDMINRIYTRWCKLIGEKGTLVWDYQKPEIQLMPSKPGFGATIFTYEPIDPYIEEMKHFLSCIEGIEKPVMDGETGKRVLEIALAARKSSKENKVVEI